jgi:hypothetical protein
VLGNAYHPGNERGAGAVAQNVGFAVLQDMGFYVLREFWPSEKSVGKAKSLKNFDDA